MWKINLGRIKYKKRANMVEILCSHIWKWEMRPVEAILRRGERDKGEWWVSLAKMCCMHFCKYHNVPLVQ
jgi:hypothetical protein